MRRRLLRSLLATAALLSACDDPATSVDAGVAADGSSIDAAADGRVYRRWLKVELPGTLCGNGSQYKFFVSWFPGATDTLIYFEAGGACWDYASCTGGARGAAHPDGVPDDLMDLWELGSPILRRNRADNPVATWNMVFVPYCTGDVHIGDRDITYEDPDGVGAPLPWHHRGFANTQAVMEWLRGEEPSIDRMLVSGCSAGGAGAINNYHVLRVGLAPRRGYLLDDSGPIFPSEGNSGPMHAMIRSVWNLDEVIRRIVPAEADRVIDNLGQINPLLAETYPGDRLATTYFQLDYDYSLYSYERFYDFPPREEVYRLWFEDTQRLTDQYDAHDNLAYYLPFFRELNNSHCLTIGSWDGTEIEEDGLDLRLFLEHLLDDDAPLTSYRELAREGPYADLAP